MAADPLIRGILVRHKYLVLFPIPTPFRERIEEIMDALAWHSGIAPPHRKLCPHVTFHRPIVGIDEKTLVELVTSMVLQSKRTRITVSHLFPFGKHYIVLPVHATLSTALLWSGITSLLERIPEYEHGPYDRDNTLHITLAEKLTPVFDKVWPAVRNLSIEEMHIPLEKVELHRKPTEGGVWEPLFEFPIPPERTASR